MKRWLFAALFALTLCLWAAPAQAAVVSGGRSYIWYQDYWKGSNVCVSADGGASYAELPGLREAQEQSGLCYSADVLPLPDGGLRVEAYDQWSEEITYRQDYSATQLERLLADAVPTPVRVLTTNGTVTVATREFQDWGQDAAVHDQLLYSTDGVTWSVAQWQGDYYGTGAWWDGEAFYGGSGGTLTSADGVHWTETEEHTDPSFSRVCELGPYRFEYAENAAGEQGVYLMDRTDPERGVLLPHMGQAALARGVSIGMLRAWYGPNDTVFLAAYDVYGKENLMVSIDYPISSLDWCLENLKTQFRYINFQAENGGGVGLGMVSWRRVGGYGYDRALVRREDADIRWAETPFRRVESIYPYNGKTFVVWGDGRLYASEDGLSWTCLEGKGLGDDYDRRLYSFIWTGDRYISCRRAVEYNSGRWATWGKEYDPACTKVTFLNENFDPIDAYDFGRQVEAVGYLDGVYYARVSDCQSVSTSDYEATQGILYRSVDGKSWTAMPRYYTADRDELLVSQRGANSQVYHPTGDPGKPQRSIAQLDRWRFVMDEVVERSWSLDAPELRAYKVYLMGDVATDWVELPHLGEAIKAQGINAWELTAAYNADGTVEVRVTDKDDPAKYIAIAYPVSSLDWVKENLMQIAGRDLPHEWLGDRWEWPMESYPGVADLVLMELANGENELIYRTPATEGHWKWYDSVPWGNEIELLEFGGKDFMVLDKADGRLYLSSDGVSWHEATGDWYKDKQQTYFRDWPEALEGEDKLVGSNRKPTQGTTGCCEAQYAMKWVGDKYMAVCFWRPPSIARYTKIIWGIPNDPDMAKVLYLDEELNLIGSHDFGCMMTGVGCYEDGTYFALTNGCTYGGNFNLSEGGERLFTSIDGENWQESDLLNVWESLVKLQ